MEPADNKNKKRLSDEINEKEKRALKAMREHKPSALSGLGMFGMIGWSVVVPALLGAALGVWLDKHYRQSFSWTLTFLIAGIILGCIIAWNWVLKENKHMHQDKEEENE